MATDERLLQAAGQGVHADEDGEVAITPFRLGRGLGDGLLDAFGELIRFFDAAVEAEQADWFALDVVGVERLRLSLFVVGDEAVGGGEDVFGAAEILAEVDDAGAWVVFFEVEDVFDVRAAPFVDRLVRIADDTEIRIVFGEAPGDGVLRLVGVLIFVDQDVLEAGVEFAAEFLVVVEGECGPEEEIVEVEGVRVAHLLLVDRIDASDDVGEEIAVLVGRGSD